MSASILARYNALQGRLVDLLELTGKLPDPNGEAFHLKVVFQEMLHDLVGQAPSTDESRLEEAERQIEEWHRALLLTAQLRGVVPPPIVSLGPSA